MYKVMVVGRDDEDCLEKVEGRHLALCRARIRDRKLDHQRSPWDRIELRWYENEDADDYDIIDYKEEEEI